MARAGDRPVSFTVDAASLKKIEFAAEAAKARILEQTAAAVKEVAETAVEDAKAGAPVDTGALRDGISAEYSEDGTSAEVGPHDPKTWYGVLIEWGDSQRPAHPFMTPAGETARTRLRTALEKHVNEAITEVGLAE